MSLETAVPPGLTSSKPPMAAVPSRPLRRYAGGVGAYNVLVVLWGSVVRATGSGNGCGDHWPLCNGTVEQHWQTVASVIEFAHRATSGIAVAALVLLVAWVWRQTPKRHLARVFAGLSVVLTFNEALLGALLVKLGLTAQNHSPARAAMLSLHLTNTLLLLAALALTAHFLGRTAGRMRGGVELRGLLPTGAALGVLLLVGVSGSLAALGDTLYPAQSLRQALLQDLTSKNWMLHLRWVHPALSLLAAGAVLYLLAGALRSRLGGMLPGLVGALLGAQIVLGLADVALLAPTWLQVLHLLGADLLWIALVVLGAELSIRSLGCTGGACARGKSPASVGAPTREEAARQAIGA